MQEAYPQPDAETPDPSPFAEQLHVPQFGIIHLMIWIAVTAVLLKVFMALAGSSLQALPPEQSWIFQVYQTVYAIMLASMAVGAGVLIRLRCYTMFKRLQPGHWLVLISTLEFILELAASLLFWLAGVMGPRTIVVIQVGAVAIYAWAAAAYPFAFFQLRDARRWKILIGAKAVGAVTGAALAVVFLVAHLFNYSPAFLSMWATWGVTRYCPIVWSVAIFLVLVSAAILDLYHRTARDWVHWLGVSVFGLTYVLGFAVQIYFMFFFRLPR
jgi:hypothetical protein